MRPYTQDGFIQPTLLFHWCTKSQHQWSEGWAMFNFAWSLIEEIMISIYCIEEETCYQQPVRVEICDRKSVCRLCNEIYLTSAMSGWRSFRIKCLDSLEEVKTEVEGNQIKIYHPGSSINICEIKFFGKG